MGRQVAGCGEHKLTSRNTRAGPDISIHNPPGLRHPRYSLVCNGLQRLVSTKLKGLKNKRTVMPRKNFLFVVARLPSNNPAIAR